MNSKLEEYFLKAKSVQKENRDKHLIQLGLNEKVYSPDGLYSPEYHLIDYTASGENRDKHYKTAPIEVTDEEYEQILKAEKNKKINIQSTSNSVASALTFIAVLTYIGGFILGIVLGNREVTEGIYYTYTTTEFVFSYAITWWIAALVSGTMILGFAEIIKLLDKISNK